MDSGGLGAHSEGTAAAAAVTSAAAAAVTSAAAAAVESAAASAGNATLAATAAAATNFAEKLLRRQVSDRRVQFFFPCLGVFSTQRSQSQYNELDSGGLGAHSEGAVVETTVARERGFGGYSRGSY